MGGEGVGLYPLMQQNTKLVSLNQKSLMAVVCGKTKYKPGKPRKGYDTDQKELKFSSKIGENSIKLKTGLRKDMGGGALVSCNITLNWFLGKNLSLS